MMEAPGESGNRWALLVGIDHYPKLRKGDLGGCVNDARLWAKILRENFQFPPEHLTLLENEAATRDGILSALDGLIERAQTDDVVVFFYAGHGSQMRDREGTKPTGMDETLLPHDSGRRPHENRDITDDEIRLWLSRLARKTRYNTLIFDCCHSATAHRDPFGEAERGVPADMRAIAELPPSPLPEFGTGDLEPAPGASPFLPPGDHFVVISACRDDETAKEHGIRDGGEIIRHGALTFCLSRQVLSHAGPGTTYRDIFEPASAQVSAAHPTQHPQCEGALDRLLFGVRDIIPFLHVPLSKVLGDSVTLAAGAAHGVVAGSQWEVYPQGSKEARPGDIQALGLLEVRTVASLTAEAHVLSSPVPPLQPLMRAVEVARPPAGQWSIEISTTGKPEERLARLLARSPWLRLATPRDRPRARAYLLPVREQAREDDPVPQLMRILEPTWALVGQEGELLMRTLRVGEEDTLFGNLEALVRFQEVLELSNPRSELSGKVEMRLLRGTAPNGWHDPPKGKGNEALFNDGDRLAVELRNGHSAAVYVTLLALSADRSISLLYPPPGAKGQALAPGVTVRVGAEEGKKLQLYSPEDLSLLPPYDGKPQAESHDFIKLFVTSESVDMSALLHRGLRDPPGNTQLAKLLSHTLAGISLRVVPVQLDPEEDWTTEMRQIVLRRQMPGGAPGYEQVP